MQKLEKKPRISVLTPAWNRVSYLGKVYESLKNQVYRDFEWIIADDGSTDGTYDLGLELLKSSDFCVKLISFSCRVGKIRCDNKLLDHARGDYVIWCDSDDYLKPTALLDMIAEWEKIESRNESADYIAVIAMCEDFAGRLISSGPKNFRDFDAPWFDLSQRLNMRGDMCIMQSIHQIASSRFPEVDLVIPESGFWYQFMNKKVRCMNKRLKVMERGAQNRISGSMRMQYCRGRANSMHLGTWPRLSQLRATQRFKAFITFHRYCIHGDLFGREKTSISPRKYRYSAAFHVAWGVGLLLAIKDTLEGRVEKSHRIFFLGKGAQHQVHSNF